MTKLSSLLLAGMMLASNALISQDTYLIGAGNSGPGSIFAINSDGSDADNWFEFVRSQESEYCQLVETSGKLWGMTTYGGVHGLGIIFSIETDGTGYTKVHDFDGLNGAEPRCRLIASGGKLWGTTFAGGSSDRGTIFSYDIISGVFQKIHDFDDTNGAGPLSGLTEANGKFWGVTSTGGAEGSGVVYRLLTNGTSFAKIHDFSSSTDGLSPITDFVENGDQLYGTVFAGAVNFDGGIFSINKTTEAFNLVYSFDDAVTGGRPIGSLAIVGGKLWGTTSRSVNTSEGNGTIFSINFNGTEYSEIYDLSDSEGSGLRAALFENDGKLWTISSSGGANDAGSILSINNDGSGFEVQYSFAINDDARSPFGALTLASGKLWGISKAGGSFGNGAIFTMDPEASSYTVIHDFNDAEPTGTGARNDLIQVGEKIYGLNGGGTKGYGGILTYDLSDGSYERIHDFDFTSGAFPSAGLIYLNDRLFGTTSGGGANKSGVLFSINVDGSDYQKLYDFPDNIGSQQFGLSVIDGKFWSNTFGNGGDIYSINFDGTGFTIVRSFDISNDGLSPTGKMILYDGWVWGTTQGGGANNAGTIFKIRPNGTEYTVIHDFDRDNGGLPNGLIKVGDKFFGLCMFDDGLVFSINSNGSGFAVNHRFGSSDRISFQTLLHAEGKIWGMAFLAGLNDLGYIFRLDEDGTNFSVVEDFTSDFGGVPSAGALLAIPLKSRQELSFTVDPKTYGDENFVVSASSNTSNPISFSTSDAQVIELSGQTASINSAGEVILSAFQPSDMTYYSRTIEQQLTVAKASLEAAANDVTVNEGDPLPSFDITYSGFVNSDTETVLDAEPTASVSVTDTNTPGNFDIVLSGGSDDNYAFTLVDGTLTVNNVLSAESIEKLIKLYPNPAVDKLLIDSDKVLQVSLYDLEGREVLQSIGVREVDLTNLQAGTYLIKVILEGEVLVTQKVIKR